MKAKSVVLTHSPSCKCDYCKPGLYANNVFVAEGIFRAGIGSSFDGRKGSLLSRQTFGNIGKLSSLQTITVTWTITLT